ncbi:hypothetical protein Tco_0321015 [Tanacetum coccineum]
MSKPLGLLVNKARVIMSSATSAVTYTSVYTDSEPGRAFWGADDEEVSEGHSMGPEDPQTPPVPQDEDEREPIEFPAEEAPLPPIIHLLLSHSDMLLSRIPRRIQRSTRMIEQRDGPGLTILGAVGDEEMMNNGDSPGMTAK